VKLEMTTSRRVSDDDLLHALALLTSPVFGSLSVAYGLAGAPSDSWRVLETFTPRQIADEIAERALNLEGLKTACSDVLAATFDRTGKDRDDYQHLMQLIGYSVSGYGDLSCHDEHVLRVADAAAERLLSKAKR